MKKNKCDNCLIGLYAIPYENLVDVSEADYYCFNSYDRNKCFIYNYCPCCGHKVVIKNDRHS